MRNNIKILFLAVIVLLVSSSCLALSGGSDSTENSNTSAPIVDSGYRQYSGPMPDPSGIITEVTMAFGADEETYAPVNPTTEFSPVDVIHAVVRVKDAPRGTKFTTRWFTTDVGDLDVPDKLIDQTEITEGGSGYLDFTLEPDQAFPEGNYRVEVYINDRPDQLVEYSIVSNGQENSSTSTDSGYVVNVTMAKGVKGVEKDPVNPTSIFEPADTIHAVVRVENAPSNTNFTSIWLVTDIGSVAEPDTVIDTVTLPLGGSGNIDFSLSPTNPFPKGLYRVEIQTEGTTVWVEDYEVR